MKLSTSIFAYGLLALFTGFLLEGLSYFGNQYLKAQGIVYTPPIAKDYLEYIAERDSVLGWPKPSSYGTSARDSSGSRIIPSFPDYKTKPCVALYGDSFTWADEVDHDMAWGNQLAIKLDCRVANFGVGGYGTDQAYLRFKNNRWDRAEISVLVHMSENIVRNVTQFFYFLYGGTGFELKPRFILDGLGDLQLVPLPDLSPDEFRAMLAHPQDFLKHDFLVPEGEGGNLSMNFPFTLNLIKAFRHYRIKARLNGGRPFWADFYREGHPSNALKITTRIIQSFVIDARAKARHPLVAIVPMVLDLEIYRKTGQWVYQPLIDRLAAEDIAVLNLGAFVEKRIGLDDPCAIYTQCKGGHFNELGNRLMAEMVAGHIKSN